MVAGLKDFVDTIDDFDNFNEDQLIEFFAYFRLIIQGNSHFNAIMINQCFETLRIPRTKSIDKYVTQRIHPASQQYKNRAIYVNVDHGYHITREYENEIRVKYAQKNKIPFSQFVIESSADTIKPSDIPFTSNSITKHALYFTRLYHLFYHLENSIRTFLRDRLNAILGSQWENELLNKVDLKRAEAIKKEVNLSIMIEQKRGDSILYYCMWEDYGKIIKEIPDILLNKKEQDELVAHMNTMTKIRNAIAHNVDKIPPDYQKEFEVFVKKYISITKQ